ncbi:General negative regulator of transcription subunit 3 [Smittium mucronatum]|uniref:General negative regulator of transcription subunit n=1 Tax=Smittium mucronatum TaxID=133383 RepID=A0A1R0H0Z7_9FUNG|nr:General negative regulator of transcription subunit 3 [Smittium mucronatum]
MEKFKAIEKEMKTKAYSKEGLLQSAKLDPKEKKRIEISNWLCDSIDKLSTQQDVYEAEAEQLNSTLGKKKKDSSKVERVKILNERVERHKYHIMCLERVQRLLENESLSTEQVEEMQEDVNYYVDENDEDEFVEDEFIYDHLNLDNEDLFNNPLDEDYSSSDDDSQPEDKDPEEAVTSNPKENDVQSTTSNSDMGIKISLVPPTSQSEQRNAWKERENCTTPSKETDTVPANSGASVAPIKLTPNIISAPVPTHALAQPWAAVAGQGLNSNNSATSNKQFRAQSSGSMTTNQSQEAPKKILTKVNPEKKIDTVGSQKPTLAQKLKTNDFSNNKQSLHKPAKSLDQTTSTSKDTEFNLTESSVKPVGPTSENLDYEQLVLKMMIFCFLEEFWPRDDDDHDLFSGKQLPGSLKRLHNFFSKTKENYSPLSKESVYRKNMMEVSLQTTPTVADQEKQKQYIPKNPVATPSYYPQTPLPLFNQPGSYINLGIDTLFFIFYYNENTYHQYLASKELKRQSWRFHKKYLTWFQRYEEPLEITNEYENGSYLYFDYETSWCQRKKNNFSFEYQYLE